MKKIYYLFTLFIALSIAAKAVTHNITVNSNFTFTPSFISGVVVGDVITWTLGPGAGTHTTTSQSVPSGASAWNSGTLTSTPYSYTVPQAGSYIYACTYHVGNNPPMAGTWNATTTVGITEPVTNLITNVYPNPFSEKITIKYNGIESIEVFNIVGGKVKSMELSSAQNKAEIDFAGFPAGVYFYRTYKEGIIVETRKIVKAN